MNYWARNIGDYAKKAGKLSMLEHGAYTILLDACYDRERFPTLEEAIDWTWARNEAEIQAVKFVLSKFFHLDGEVYVQNRVKDELEKYWQTSERNKKIATDREQKRRERTRSVHESCENDNEPSPNQEPITNNHKPVTINQEPKESKSKALVHPSDAPPQKRFIKPSLEDVQSFILENAYTVKAGSFWNYYESKGWKVGTSPMKDWKAAVRQWQSKEARSSTTGTLIEGDRDL